MEDGPSTANSSSLPSYTSSVRTATARQAYKRIRKVITLQWRAIAIVLVIISDVVFFCVVFVYMDNTAVSAMEDVSKIQPWLLCLVLNSGDKNKCLNLTGDLVLNETTAMAVLILLSMNGIWCLFLVGRWSMLVGWVELIKTRCWRRREFVSLDARRSSKEPQDFEMLRSPGDTPAQTPGPPMIQSHTPVMSPGGTLQTNLSPVACAESQDYFGHDAKYTSPHLSFSSPRPPSSGRESLAGRDWDPSATFARATMWPGSNDLNKI
ncbi:MAG: hypothetical protein M1825_001828 [Sarcosagium campestre]|nr:MAG: hypothetical protein M1825_001828 [Sarcosagium campestre]